MPKKVGFQEARQKIARFCSSRERSPKEVADKLKSWGIELDEVKKLMEELRTQNFIDEQRFANAFCHDKFEFHSWGKQKIRKHIQVHSISEEVVERAMERIESERYESRILALFKKKWDVVKDENLISKKRKVFAFLASKGFEQDLIWKAMNLESIE